MRVQSLYTISVVKGLCVQTPSDMNLIWSIATSTTWTLRSSIISFFCIYLRLFFRRLDGVLKTYIAFVVFLWAVSPSVAFLNRQQRKHFVIGHRPRDCRPTADTVSANRSSCCCYNNNPSIAPIQCDVRPLFTTTYTFTMPPRITADDGHNDCLRGQLPYARRGSNDGHETTTGDKLRSAVRFFKTRQEDSEWKRSERCGPPRT